MRYKSLFTSRRPAPPRGYFKEGVELVYPAQDNGLKIAILPAYNPAEPDDPAGWIPAIGNDSDEESEFYTMVRAAKFVGHGNKHVRVSIASPQTFDEAAIDPYAALYDFCSRSDYWSYLTKDRRGRTITGDPEGAVLPKQKDLMVCNVIDLTLGTRGGVFVTELSEAVAKSLLYAKKKGKIMPGILMERDELGVLRHADMTNPDGALAISIEWTGIKNKGYVAKPLLDDEGEEVRVAIPESLLPHRRHMENPATFINAPSPQDVVSQLYKLLRGYHDNPKGIDEAAALKDALEEAFGDMFRIDVPATQGVVSFGGVKELPEDMVRQMDKHGLPLSFPEKREIDESDESEGSEDSDGASEESHPEDAKANRPTGPGEDIDPMDIARIRESLTGSDAGKAKGDAMHNAQKPEESSAVKEPMPGEDIDPADIANIRAMLSGGKQ